MSSSATPSIYQTFGSPPRVSHNPSDEQQQHHHHTHPNITSNHGNTTNIITGSPPRLHRQHVRPPDSTRVRRSRRRSRSPGIILLLFAFTTLLRILIGFHHHSGQDNHHGSKVAYGGDFEAQRHWMELTLHLPVGDWYWYDLEYWGLDYPPLTAYVSYVCGWISHHLVGPHTVALDESRGIEDPVHKAYMRATVLVLDVLVYGTAVWWSTYRGDKKSLWAVMIALIQPAILLIDHGHFQYNTVALGLSIAAFYAMVQGPAFESCVWGGFFFVLALNFKQMTLYYAPVVFFYLLGRCLARPTWFLPRILWLGFVVLFTFYVLWEPFIKYPPSQDVTVPYFQRLQHVLRRIFPFQRGLFEGKVSNLWCALNTSPINIRDRIPSEQQPLLALAATAVLMLPSCIRILCLGCHEPYTRHLVEKHWNLLLWATTSCALSFFLASFQVHEKSILLALAPCTLLLWQDPDFVEWFSFVCVWSLWPLLQVDRLQLAYGCTVAIFASMVWFRRMGMGQLTVPTVFSGNVLLRIVPFLSYVGMIGLHVAQVVVPPPPTLPDLYEVLWSVMGCGMFVLAWMVTVGKLYFSQPVSYSTTSKVKTE
ncbi:dolichyl-P-Glc:Man9GlcNAc2-PP-dolichyl glucosyltransferase [Nitzschia inconspicua]|uniref:Alpha-1,3-glucosyltransferase n=1 Tax=Nitzschia inconspicua TaxID=303405 RepID=A0A9K3KUQ3_9STRA|nr:dolichyl-P-Glc:Man9GlcNAc2-PP-dolichyl glucosyltransferase [Nitzschia inconspicua]